MVKDRYPEYAGVPDAFLVSPDDQPEFVPLPDFEVAQETNLVHWLLERHVDGGRGGHPALIEAESGRRWTYSDLAAASGRCARVLADLGVGPGDRVAVRSPNVAEAVITWLATWGIGGVVALTPPQARAAEIPFFLNDTRAKVLVVANKDPYASEALACADQFETVEQILAFPDASGTPWHSWSELMDAVVEPAPTMLLPKTALGIIWHTGGTTGVPKACYHTHERLLLGAEAGRQAYGVRDDDVHIFPAPVGHAAGWLSRATYGLYPGITTIEVEGFADPHRVLGAISEHRVSWAIALATSWAAMLSAYEEDPGRYDLSSLRRTYGPFLSGSGRWLYDAWEGHGLRLLNPMGSTAFGSWFVVPRHDADVPPMAVGSPSPGYEVRIVQPGVSPITDVEPGEYGQVAVQGPTGLTYWNRPELQARDVREGWTLIDDLARRDENGVLWYMGRTDMMIVVSGYKVAPVEVEEVIAGHPAIREVAVTGAPDKQRGEVVMAWVVPADDVEVTEELGHEIQELVKQRISPYKYPRRIQFMRSLPHDPVGKIIVKTLQAWARGDGEPEDALGVRI